MMKQSSLLNTAFFLAIVCFASIGLSAQGTLSDYERAVGLQAKFQGTAVNLPGPTTWIMGTNHFWYRRTVTGGSEIVWVDTVSLTRRPAFDHEKLAVSLSAAAAETYMALKLPLGAAANLIFVDSEKAIEFNAKESRWKCDLTEYKCTRTGPAPGLPAGGNTPPQLRPTVTPQPDRPRNSPDGNWEAVIKNYNIVIRSKDKKTEFALSFDGSEDNYYALGTIAWSPDSKKIAAYRVRPGYHRKIQYVESSPLEQLQPKYWTIEYAKPGDTVDIEQPVLFTLDTKQQIVIDNALFQNPYDMTNLVWRKDNRAFTFEFNKRGHQEYRVIEVDAATGKARALIDETSKTFFCYSGKKYRFDVGDGKETIWMSERDGWNHLYLFGADGQIKNQITKGEWVVRGVEKVDEEKRQM